MMGRRKIVRKNNGHIRGSSLTYVVLLMVFLVVPPSGYMAISRYNMKAVLENRCYMKAQLSAKTIHHSFYETASSGGSPAMNLIRQNFQKDCDKVREESSAMMDEEGVEEREDGEPRVESSPSEEDTDTMSVEEEFCWERYLYHVSRNKKYVVRGKGHSRDSGGADDGMVDIPVAGDFTTGNNITDSTTIIDITLAAHPLKSLAMAHTRVKSSGYSFSAMVDIILGDRDGSVMVTSKSYRSSRKDDPETRVYLNGNGIHRCYEDNRPREMKWAWSITGKSSDTTGTAA